MSHNTRGKVLAQELMMPRKVSAPVIPPASKKLCCFCGLSDVNELEHGKFHEYNGIFTHYYCLLLSSNMQQLGSDDEGILGFLPDDINKELRRGRKLACCYCKRTGATLGCCNTKCKKMFHFPCGLKAGTLHQFFGEFRSYCKYHRPMQNIDKRIAEQVKNKDCTICYICFDDANPQDIYGTLWAPCCKKNAWFHRKCVQQLAMSAGYFFKCPLCNNKTEFQRAMLDQGIFIPSQDASWELVPNAFEELLYRHNRCDASKCLCPKGRGHTSANAKWELTLCKTCGSQGIHMACGGLKWVNPTWECSECTSILTKSATPSKRKISTFIRNPLRDDDESNTGDESSESDISVGGGTQEQLANLRGSSSKSDNCSLEFQMATDPNNSRDTDCSKRIPSRPNSPEVNVTITHTTSKVEPTDETLPPLTKRPRLYESSNSQHRRESTDSDDDIIIISGPSQSEKTKEKLQPHSNAWMNVLKNVTKKSKDNSQVELTSKLSPSTPKSPSTDDNSKANILLESSDSELTIKISNVTSLAPEYFASVQEHENPVHSSAFQTPTANRKDSQDGRMSQSNKTVENNNMNYVVAPSFDMLNIVRIDGASPSGDANNVRYSLTIPGTNHTVPLKVPATDNGMRSLLPNDVSQSIKILPRLSHDPWSVPLKSIVSQTTPNILQKTHTIAKANVKTESKPDVSLNTSGVGTITQKQPETTGQIIVPKGMASTPMQFIILPANGFPTSQGNICFVSSTVPQASNPVTSNNANGPNGLTTSNTSSPFTQTNASGPKSSTSVTVPVYAIVQANGFPQLTTIPPNNVIPMTVPSSTNPTSGNVATTSIPTAQSSTSLVDNETLSTVIVSNDTWTKPELLRAVDGTVSSNAVLTKINTNVTNNMSNQASTVSQSKNIQKDKNLPLFTFVCTESNDGTATVKACHGAAGSGTDVRRKSPNTITTTGIDRSRCTAESSCRHDDLATIFDRSHTITDTAFETTDYSENDSESERAISNSDSCDRSRLIPKIMSLRDLKFAMRSPDVLKITLCESYSIDVKMDSANKCKYAMRNVNNTWRTVNESSVTQAETSRATNYNLSNNKEHDTIVEKFENGSQSNAAALESLTQMNELSRIEVRSRGQDELKENLDPVPPSPNPTHNVNATDRKSKTRMRSVSHKHSIRSLNDNDVQDSIYENSESSSKAHDSEIVFNTNKRSLNSWQNTIDETPRNYGSPIEASISSNLKYGGDADISDEFPVSKRRRISLKDGDFIEIRNTKNNLLVSNAEQFKEKNSISYHDNRSDKYDVNNILNDRKIDHPNDANELSYKVSIDLSRIRKFLKMKLEESGLFANYKFRENLQISENEQKKNDRLELKSVVMRRLSRSRSLDSLTGFDGYCLNQFSVAKYRKSKSLERLNDLSNELKPIWTIRNYNASLRTPIEESGRKNLTNFEKHDCVR